MMRIREIISELTFMGRPCTKDCSGHRAGYEWSMRHNGQQANTHSPSFNRGSSIPSSQQAGRRAAKKQAKTLEVYGNKPSLNQSPHNKCNNSTSANKW